MITLALPFAPFKPENPYQYKLQLQAIDSHLYALDDCLVEAELLVLYDTGHAPHGLPDDPRIHIQELPLTPGRRAPGKKPMIHDILHVTRAFHTRNREEGKGLWGFLNADNTTTAAWWRTMGAMAASLIDGCLIKREDVCTEATKDLGHEGMLLRRSETISKFPDMIFAAPWWDTLYRMICIHEADQVGIVPEIIAGCFHPVHASNWGFTDPDAVFNLRVGMDDPYIAFSLKLHTMSVMCCKIEGVDMAELGLDLGGPFNELVEVVTGLDQIGNGRSLSPVTQ